MNKSFSIGIFGYKKKEVTQYMKELEMDYEEELKKKQERMLDLAEENRILRQEIQKQDEKIKDFAEQEKLISRVLIEAQEKAENIMNESRQKAELEMSKLQIEKEKWQNKFREIRQELLAFENNLLMLIERFRDEVNYYTAQEISTELLADEYTETILQDKQFSSINIKNSSEEKKEKVIA
ncbi:MAG: DivIVA domain-containing protein [Caldicoprobacterales bacterium]|jgi:cell division septum initiation protein DivIVA|nr:hypothetical protein [Clostridiales bacterium]